MMTLGKGADISNSNKQKLNVGSSKEGELIATHDQIPDLLYTLYFIVNLFYFFMCVYVHLST